MQAVQLREAFVRLIQRFNAGELDIPEMSAAIERLTTQGLHHAFANPKEARALYEYTWTLDFYRPDHQPRTGLLGRLRDTLGGPRFTAAQVKARAREIERVMGRHSA